MWQNRNCYNCRDFGHIAKNCRNREIGGRIREDRRLEYGGNNRQKRMIEEGNEQSNLNRKWNLILLN